MYYLVERVTEKGTSLTKYRESTITNQTLYIEKENEKIRYLLTEFADDYEIRKKNAAKITHVYMNDILGISDVTDPESLQKATKLKDLYDCRVCVMDITQMYVMGIMDASVKKPVLLFGSEELFTKEDAQRTAAGIIKYLNWNKTISYIEN